MTALADALRAYWTGLDGARLGPAQVAAFEAEYEVEVARALRVFVPVLTAFNVAFWATDAWVFAEVPGAAATLGVGRAVTVGIAAVAFLALVAAPRRVAAITVVGGFAACLTVAVTFARIGGPSTAWFHFLYPFALSPLAVYFRPGRRVAVTALFGLAILGGYFGASPAYLGDPMAACTLAHFGYIELFGLAVGLYVDRVRLRTWALKRALEDERARLADRVAEQTHDLRRLARRLDELREHERKHLARELHDELGQTLTALRLALKVATTRYERDPAGIRANLAQFGALLDDLTQQTRRILRDLRPPALDDLGLGAAVEWLAGQLERRGGPPCAVDVPAGCVGVPPDLAGVAYRCVQEALTNVARHARAASVRVRVALTDGELRAVVEDDGVGFGGAPTEGLGLVGMRERAAAMGGRVAVASAPGRGTRVTLSLPLPVPAEGAA